LRKTIEEDLPSETEFLRRYAEFSERVGNNVDMPDRIVDLFRFLRQNNGRMSNRAREGEFAELTHMLKQNDCPSLVLEISGSLSEGQIRTRVDAFLEMISDAFDAGADKGV